MTDERWAVVWQLFVSARDMPAGKYSAILTDDSLDPEIRSELLALLEASSSYTLHSSIPSAVPPGAEYSPGREFGRYVIVSVIGHGGFGTIYAARDRDLRRLVALKVLSVQAHDGLRPLMEEARAASALNHPNIVTVYETIFIDNHPAIVMEFVDGQSLRQFFTQSPGPLPIEKVVAYGQQLAHALDAAHQAGILHRDVKPENILLRKDGYVKLVDFGLAINPLTLDDAAARSLTGTLRYMSPEQLRGEPSSAASDVFSLALVLYEAATGGHAFPGLSPLDTADAIATMQAPPPSRKAPRIPVSFDRLLMAMLAKKTTSRPSADIVAQTLEQIANHPRTWIKRSLLWIGAMVALLTAASLYFTRHPAALSLRLDTKPLTGDGGWENNPALSNDGRWVVYSWQKASGGKPVTLVREIGSERKTVLAIPAPYAWLPDNRHIGFVRSLNGHDTLKIIQMNGTGEEEVLHATGIRSFEWSSDGHSIAYAASRPDNASPAIFLYSRQTRQTKQITFPPSTSQGDDRLAISPDGKQLAFRRTFNFGNSDIFLIDLPASGSPRQITFHQTEGEALAWIRDGSAIVSSTFRGSNYSLWLNPLQPPERTSRLTEVGLEAFSVRAAARRNRLLWVNSLDDSNIWSASFDGGTPSRIVSSAVRDVDVTVSTRGLLAFRSDRSGFPEIWISGADGESQTKVTNLESFTGSPRWSPNGLRLAFDSRRRNTATDIYVMDCNPAQLQCSSPVRVTNDASTDALPSWSADGSYLYFASQRSSRWEAWKVPATSDDRRAIQVTTGGGYRAQESEDGAWLYYSRIDSEPVTGVWRKKLDNRRPLPGESGEMILPLQYRATATWVLTGHEIFYQTLNPPGGHAAVYAFDLQTRQTRVVYSAGDVPLGRGLGVWPDGKSVFFVRLDRSESNIVISDYDIIR